MANSAIGKYLYYVHYYASNYKTPSSNLLSDYAKSKVRASSGKLQTNISVKRKQEFANLISALIGKDSGSSNLTSSEIANTKTVIEDMMINQVNEYVKSAGFISQTGAVLSGNSTSKGTSGGASRQKRYLSIDQLENLEDSLRDRLAHVQSLLKQVTKGSAKQAQLIQLESNILTMFKEINALKQLQDSELKTLKEWNEGLFGAKTDTSLRMDLKKYETGTQTIYSLLKDINKALVQFKMQDSFLRVASGFYGEAVTAAAALYLGNNINQITAKSISNQMTGKNYETIKYLINGVPAEVIEKLNLDIQEQHVDSNGTKTLITARSSQQKIDVIVDFPIDTSNELKKIGVSVKNINLKHHIHIVSGTPLWYLLQSENPKTFLRHWLNTMAEHNALKEKTMSNEQQNIEFASISSIQRNRKDAIFAAKLISGYKALTGDNIGRSAAQLFIVNDTSSKHGKVYVLEMNDILKAILLGVLEGNAIDNYFEFDQSVDFDDLYIKNQWDEDSLHNRMANLLNDLHAKKMYISLKNTVLNKEFITKAGGKFITAN